MHLLSELEAAIKPRPRDVPCVSFANFMDVNFPGWESFLRQHSDDARSSSMGLSNSRLFRALLRESARSGTAPAAQRPQGGEYGRGAAPAPFPADVRLSTDAGGVYDFSTNSYSPVPGYNNRGGGGGGNAETMPAFFY
jgi:hypothetical protein